MGESKAPLERPWWVKVGLWGVPSRAAACGFVWLAVLLAVGGIMGGFWDVRFFAGGLFLFAALGYWLAIRWVDQHGGWS